MPHIGNDDEGRWLVAPGKQADVVLGLASRVEHEHVPSPLSGAPPAYLRLPAEQVRLPVHLLVAALFLSRLLGLQHEAIALVEVNTTV